jgi:hypothetical protein
MYFSYPFYSRAFYFWAERTPGKWNWIPCVAPGVDLAKFLEFFQYLSRSQVTLLVNCGVTAHAAGSVNSFSVPSPSLSYSIFLPFTLYISHLLPQQTSYSHTPKESSADSMHESLPAVPCTTSHCGLLQIFITKQGKKMIFLTGLGHQVPLPLHWLSFSYHQTLCTDACACYNLHI